MSERVRYPVQGARTGALHSNSPSGLTRIHTHAQLKTLPLPLRWRVIETFGIFLLYEKNHRQKLHELQTQVFLNIVKVIYLI